MIGGEPQVDPPETEVFLSMVPVGCLEKPADIAGVATSSRT